MTISAGPLVSLLTDFGSADPSVAICKGVVLRICPTARLLDVSHAVPRHDLAHGAALLWAALQYLPVGVHLAVVDPGVGTGRRPVAIRAGRGDFLVGPDNGLLMAAAHALGGVEAAHLLADEAYRLSPVSATFHGRDIFAPAAGHLAGGVALSELGPALDPATLVELPLAPPRASPGRLEASVAFVDTWGNVQLLAQRADLETSLGPLSEGGGLRLSVIEAAAPRHDSFEVPWHATYGAAAPGRPLLYVDSYGRLALAVNLENAAQRYGLRPGDRLALERA